MKGTARSANTKADPGERRRGGRRGNASAPAPRVAGACRVALVAAGAALSLAAAADAPGSLEPMSSTYLLKLVGGLVLIVVGIFALAWLTRKFNLNQASTPGPIRVLAGINVGTRDRIVLIQVGGEQILVGMSPGRMTRLHTLEQPLEITPGPAAGGAFAGRLASLMNPTRESR